MQTKPDCRACRDVYAMKDQEPPCSECLPDLLPENINAARIWGLVQDQRIWVGGGMSEPVSAGLMHEPVWRLIDEFDVDDRFDTFLKVLRVYENIVRFEREEKSS